MSSPASHSVGNLCAALCSLPGPAAGWVEVSDRRPFVGSLTCELPMHRDQEVGWHAADLLRLWQRAGLVRR